ncbi:hypothetical protein DB30_01543 [Enhygromyxa salina]|uniref:Uncharacterized protein n=1 Tax=Enhygromyxa salina TaxID=215803 RepID=A0A0C2CWX4_9BACT|nr:hypothetical protein [Enhygromyxa salina]KIG12352.1 hypothetical protein DB30_01543 [Enhygromyxa salina]
MACPFCGATQQAISSPLRSTIAGFVLVAATMLGSSACARNPSMSDEGNTTTTNGDSTETVSDSSSSETETSTMGDGDGDTSDQSSNASLSFYACAPTDDWWVSDCDPFAQDCPEGEKCVPYASTGSNLDSNKCVPVTGSQAAGEPCAYGGVVEASDDCDQDSHCFHIEENDGSATGTCTAFCKGTPDDPLCEEGSACLIDYDGSLTLCLDTCHPLMQDCVDGHACKWLGNAFLCELESDNAAATGDPCDDVNTCASGNLCADVDFVPGCQGGSCCTEFCDTADQNFVCSNPQTECVPFFEEPEMQPPGFETIGLCVTP